MDGCCSFMFIRLYARIYSVIFVCFTELNIYYYDNKKD